MASGADMGPDVLVKAEVAMRLERQLDAAQQITHIGSWQWNVASGEVSPFQEGNSNSALSLSRHTLAFTRVAMHHPAEVFVVNLAVDLIYARLDPRIELAR